MFTQSQWKKFHCGKLCLTTCQYTVHFIQIFQLLTLPLKQNACFRRNKSKTHFIFIFCNFNIKNNSYNNSRFPKRGGVGEARRVSSSCLHFAKLPFLAPSVFVITPSPFFDTHPPDLRFYGFAIVSCFFFLSFCCSRWTVPLAEAHTKRASLFFFLFCCCSSSVAPNLQKPFSWCLQRRTTQQCLLIFFVMML